jgi:arylsulfatase
MVTDCVAAGKDPKETMRAAGFRPDLKKRGSLRTVVDGRYKLTRYFAPVDRHEPETLDELFKANDVELFDLQADPQERVNLATDRNKNRDLLLVMSAKLETLIKAEIGVDDGRELPEISGITWTLDRMD